MKAESIKKIFRRLSNLNGIVYALLLLIIIVSIGSDKFLTTSNLMNILRQAAILGIMACAGVCVIIGANLDLSVGSILSLCALVSCTLTGTGTVAAMVVPLAIGAVCGIFNGFLVGILRFNPFIATLGTMSVIQSIAFFYCDGQFLTAPTNEVFKQIGQGSLGMVPIPVLILVVIFVCFYYLLNKTTFGRAVYIVGGNPECAKYSGISYGKTTILSYMLAGIGAAITAIILVAKQMAAQPEMGSGYEFSIITAIVVGGVSLSGGKGKIWGALLGVLFIGILKNAFILLSISLYYQYSVMGIILVLAVGMDAFSERRVYIDEKN